MKNTLNQAISWFYIQKQMTALNYHYYCKDSLTVTDNNVDPVSSASLPIIVMHSKISIESSFHAFPHSERTMNRHSFSSTRV